MMFNTKQDDKQGLKKYLASMILHVNSLKGLAFDIFKRSWLNSG